MEPNADQSQIRSALKDVVCADPDVVFAVVFGSQLSGTATHSSDFDIAVKFTADCSERDRFKKRCVLSGELQHEEFPFIDVSDIDSLPLDVAHDAVNGDLLYGDKRAFEQFKLDSKADSPPHRGRGGSRHPLPQTTDY
ncbi:nucleotidyltransferase domain-containing protein [Halorubrum ezzemoulense]|uniref:nucleotidyltransferase domain-containing protein n=1 Tax=Halorubrum ezzemoulense TaxID=337243 RepID=UPI00232DCDCB|nr:nucleotidyltransferase domain-containing protein [Halorubrum ezzemoulense]MDB9249164.1 nucleotidyltransferase domain-containing protein [Halorubrum ezzemoulense]MDB9259680.1 nucleotidyltransferase domain-containing protein [Halorubrum ezzemoulense]MDB9263145.1 nucleotidyltransferase domain-containing protein [Halorubrum ezzemoulense]MDB9266425.1 nucleotidyltransferase domain-containing protein [Halorubrum ezzemoulense]MDB9270041.1 nucleotidyltransferase domain-containing protein [Halorubrum